MEKLTKVELLHALRFVNSILKSDEAINFIEYEEKLKEYAKKRGLQGDFVTNTSKTIEMLLKREQTQISITAPQLGFEWAGGIALAAFTGKIILIPSNYVIYPIKVVKAWLDGEKVKHEEGDSLVKIFKHYTTKYSPTGKALQHLATFYRLAGVNALHNRLQRNLRKKAKSLFQG